jgi:hypothetical protein
LSRVDADYPKVQTVLPAHRMITEAEHLLLADYVFGTDANTDIGNPVSAMHM